METQVQVPQLGESITEATVSAWLKSAGDLVADGDILVELETDKVMVEVPATQAGVIQAILKQEGDRVEVGEALCTIDANAKAGAKKPAEAKDAPSAPASQPASPSPAAAAQPAATQAVASNDALSPAVRRMVEENNLNPATIPATGRDGRLTKEDVVNFLEQGATPTPAAPSQPATAPAQATPAAELPNMPPRGAKEREERVPMSRLRQRIAERLLQAQQNAAILTTFNEVDMSAVMALRGKYKDAFKEKYGMPIGFMSFFTKACIEGLRAFPAVNAEISGDEIIYKNYYDIGVAVGTERGLVVPVVRDADHLRFIEIELRIAELAKKARDGKLGLDDLSGGTFSITNGGIYGSMLSTPILNPPQSGILGMHNIVKRPVVIGDQIEIRPMMYVALSYDHRIIDGREAVQFLVKIKESIEDPARMMLEI